MTTLKSDPAGKEAESGAKQAESEGPPTPVPPGHAQREWFAQIERRPGWSVIALALLLFGAILALKVLEPDPGEGVLLLLVVPIALLAMRFGTVGGAVAGVLAILLLALSEALGAPGFGALGYLTRALTFLTLGLILGSFAEQLRDSRAIIGGRRRRPQPARSRLEQLV